MRALLAGSVGIGAWAKPDTASAIQARSASARGRPNEAGGTVGD
jgi:hypothetical protein